MLHMKIIIPQYLVGGFAPIYHFASTHNGYKLSQMYFKYDSLTVKENTQNKQNYPTYCLFCILIDIIILLQILLAIIILRKK